MQWELILVIHLFVESCKCHRSKLFTILCGNSYPQVCWVLHTTISANCSILLQKSGNVFVFHIIACLSLWELGIKLLTLFTVKAKKNVCILKVLIKGLVCNHAILVFNIVFNAGEILDMRWVEVILVAFCAEECGWMLGLFFQSWWGTFRIITIEFLCWRVLIWINLVSAPSALFTRLLAINTFTGFFFPRVDVWF